MTQTILYARVSTAEQTISHQKTQAKAAGYKIDQVVSDDGVSGVSAKLADRPEGTLPLLHDPYVTPRVLISPVRCWRHCELTVFPLSTTPS